MFYQTVPITEKPEKDGWYIILDPENPYSPEACYFLEGDWFESEIDARENENHDSLDVDGCSWLREVEHLPPSRQQADPSVLVEALEELRNKYLATIDSYKEFSNNAYAWMNVKAADMWNHKRDGFIVAEWDIRKLLTTYKESKPSPSITREQAEKIFQDGADSYRDANRCFGDSEFDVRYFRALKRECLKQFDKQ